MDKRTDELTGPTKAAQQRFKIAVISLAQRWHREHGLRQGDWARYRRFCTKKLRKLRCRLKFKQGHKRFAPKIIPVDFTDRRFLLLPFLQAERCWSHGMDVKAMHVKDKARNFRPSILRRLKRGARLAYVFVKLCESRGTDQTQQEAKAYFAWITAIFLTESREWSQAIPRLHDAHSQMKKLKLLHMLSPKPDVTSNYLEERLADLSYRLRETEQAMEATGRPFPSFLDTIPISGPTEQLAWRGSTYSIPAEVHKTLISMDVHQSVNSFMSTKGNWSMLPWNKNSEIEGDVRIIGQICSTFDKVSASFREAVLPMLGNDMPPAIVQVAAGYAHDWLACVSIEKELVCLVLRLVAIRKSQNLRTTEVPKKDAQRITNRIDRIRMVLHRLRKPIEDGKDDTSDSLKGFCSQMDLVVRNLRAVMVAQLVGSSHPNQAIGLYSSVRARHPREFDPTLSLCNRLISLADIVKFETMRLADACLVSYSAQQLVHEKATFFPKDTQFPIPFAFVVPKPIFYDMASTEIPVPDLDKPSPSGILTKLTSWWHP